MSRGVETKASWEALCARHTQRPVEQISKFPRRKSKHKSVPVAPTGEPSLKQYTHTRRELYDVSVLPSRLECRFAIPAPLDMWAIHAVQPVDSVPLHAKNLAFTHPGSEGDDQEIAELS